MNTPPLTATVIIATLNRPECLRRALDALEAQEVPPTQVIVVDASRNENTLQVIADFPSVLYLKKPECFGHVAASRNAALFYARGEIIAFLDDDAYAYPAWLKHLLAAYDRPEIGGVGGRALNHQPGEATQGRDAIGRLLPNGFLTGNFAANPGRVVDADHLIGCNMSFRREALARLGGFRDEFWGISGICEDTDMCLRVRALGYTLRFEPAACADHDGAPQVIGRRFDARYIFFHRRNSLVMLVRNFGASPMVPRFLVAIATLTSRDCLRNIGGAFAGLACSAAGVMTGMVCALLSFRAKGTDPIRRDPAGQAIRAALETPSGAPRNASTEPALTKL